MNDKTALITEQLHRLQMLMHRLQFDNFVERDVRFHNPHRGQGRILALLKMEPEISQRDLTYLLGMSRQAIAQALDKLERSGYITRETSGEDKRVLIIKLTEEGRKAADRSDDRSPDSLIDCLTDEEQTQLSSYLDRIIKRYEEEFPGEDFEGRRSALEEFLSRIGREHGMGGHGFRPGNFDFDWFMDGGPFRHDY